MRRPSDLKDLTLDTKGVSSVYSHASHDRCPLPSLTMQITPPAPDRRIEGKRLAQVRAEHDVYDTRDKVAVAAGLNSKSVQRAEQGNATYETLEAICFVLGENPLHYWVPLDDRARPLSAHEKLDKILDWTETHP